MFLLMFSFEKAKEILISRKEKGGNNKKGTILEKEREREIEEKRRYKVLQPRIEENRWKERVRIDFLKLSCS